MGTQEDIDIEMTMIWKISLWFKYEYSISFCCDTASKLDLANNKIRNGGSFAKMIYQRIGYGYVTTH